MFRLFVVKLVSSLSHVVGAFVWSIADNTFYVNAPTKPRTTINSASTRSNTLPKRRNSPAHACCICALSDRHAGDHDPAPLALEARSKGPRNPLADMTSLRRRVTFAEEWTQIRQRCRCSRRLVSWALFRVVRRVESETVVLARLTRGLIEGGCEWWPFSRLGSRRVWQSPITCTAMSIDQGV